LAPAAPVAELLACFRDRLLSDFDVHRIFPHPGSPAPLLCKRQLEFRRSSAIQMPRRIELAQLIVRNLEEAVKRKLKRRAARHGHSMEQETREILRNAVKDEGRRRKGLGTEIVELFKGIGLEKPIQELRGYPVQLVQPVKFDDD
jgi:antitoxin FitA